jgi:hypothetical protein
MLSGGCNRLPGSFLLLFGEAKKRIEPAGYIYKKIIPICRSKKFYSSFFLDKKRNKKIKDKRMAPPVYPAHAT